MLWRDGQACSTGLCRGQSSARPFGEPVLRNLDAIHVATAQVLGDVLDHVIAYDKQLLSAAAGLELAVNSPGRPDLGAGSP